MYFFFIQFFILYVGRKIGWSLCRWRGGFYKETRDLFGLIFYCVLWGAAIAFLIGGIIHEMHPNIWNRWIMGYFLGAYVSIPNYGLLDAASVPYHVQKRHMIISGVPLIAYIAFITYFSNAAGIY